MVREKWRTTKVADLNSPAVRSKSFLEMPMMHMRTMHKITFQKNFINLIMQMQISQASMLLPEVLFFGGLPHSARFVNTILKEGVDMERTVSICMKTEINM